MKAEASAKRPVRFSRSAMAVTLVVLAIVVITVVGIWRVLSPAAIVAPDFTLIDQNGAPFTLSALRGHPVALFFGYTHCPDECPTTLAHLAKAVQSSNAPRDVRIAFITVDPERDSPLVLKRYIGLFNRDFIGLTGSLRELNPVYDAYRVPRQVQPGARPQIDYAVTHGTTIYYVGRDGSIKGFGQLDDAIPEIARHFHDFQ